MDRAPLLKELQSKATFPEADFPAFADLFEPLCLKRRQHLYIAGDVVKHVTFVLKGSMRHYYVNEEGVERTVILAEENWWIGDLVSFKERTPKNMNLQAIEDCDLLIITRENFDRALAGFPGFNEYYTKGTQKTYLKLMEQVGLSLADSAELKYQRLLRDRPHLLIRVPQHYIASFLGITPESLSRLRKKLAGA
jgi:CRP-like cAMP-binding protein